jgi:hypothetical protein
MSEYFQNFPEYVEEEYNKNAKTTESKILLELNNYKSPKLTKSEIYYNEKDLKSMPAKYAKPKYIKTSEIYDKEIKPKMEEVIKLPTKQKKKK